MKNFKGMKEEEILRLAKNGDEKAKELIINKYKGTILSFINKYYNGYTMSNELKQDLISEGYYAILKSINDYDETKAKFSTFVYIQVRNSVQLGLKQTMKSLKYGEKSFDSELNSSSEDKDTTLYDVVKDESVDIEKDYIDRDEKERMWSIIYKLCTPNEISTFKLLAKDDLSYEDIAKELGTTVSAICRRKDRGTKKIKKYLEKGNKLNK